MKKFILLAAMFAALISCGKAGGTHVKTVAVSIYPMYDIIKNIAGTNLNVIYIIPAGANPHTFEPTPSQIERISDSDAFIGVSKQFDEWAMNFFGERTPAYFLVEPAAEGGESGSDINPHIWLSLREVNRMLPRIVQILSNIDPVHGIEYLANAKQYRVTLDKADKEIEGLLSPFSNKRIIEWHPSWDYFAKDYGIEIVGILEEGHGEEPSVQDFEKLVKLAKAKNVKILVIDAFAESRLVDSLSSETGAEVLTLDTLGMPKDGSEPSYIEIMRNNARALADMFATTR